MLHRVGSPLAPTGRCCLGLVSIESPKIGVDLPSGELRKKPAYNVTKEKGKEKTKEKGSGVICSDLVGYEIINVLVCARGWGQEPMGVLLGPMRQADSFLS